MVQTVKDFILYIVLGVGGGSSAAIIFKQSGKNMTSNLIYVINETLTFYFRFCYNFALKLT